MPYIKKENREKVDKEINALIEKIIETPANELNGTLNYIITRLLESSMTGEIRYNKINNMVGVLECAKMEMYDRIAKPYEFKKMCEEGDVKETEELISKLNEKLPF